MVSVTAPRTAREQLLEVAAREGWTVLHDLGLHVVLRRNLIQLAMQFDVDGACVWCQGQQEPILPLETAFRALVALPPRSPRQGGHL